MREALANFASAMEAKLRKNDHKTDWKDLPIRALLRKLDLEVEEFKIALEYESSEEACDELVDVANFAFMIRDRIQQEENDVG